jgi:hypothetical protein
MLIYHDPCDGKEFEAEFTADGRLIKMEVKD